MNKKTFLNELKQRIAILEDTEQQDILAEYAQHIEMRMENGLSEEDAIRDFGDLGQLTEEILEAYHVKPLYQQGEEELADTPSRQERFQDRLSSCGASAKDAGHRVGTFCAKAGHSIGSFFTRIGHRIADCFRDLVTVCRNLFHRAPKEAAKNSSPAPHTPLFPRFCTGCARIWRGLLHIAKELLRLFWNLFLLLCAICIVLLILLLLVCLGFFFVLLLQGYPLTGIILTAFGSLVCCITLLVFGGTVIWHRSKKEEPYYDEM